MCGFLIGTACLVGLIVTLARGRGGCGRFGGGRFFWSGRGGYGRGGVGSRWFLRGVFERLDTTPGQEKVIVAAVEEVREAAASLRGELRQTRADVAKAARSASFDETLMGEAFARHDQAIETVRKAAVGAMAKIHAALDDKQRERLADILESGPPFFGGFGGPYRRHSV